jgi:hypothetical protein
MSLYVKKRQFGGKSCTLFYFLGGGGGGGSGGGSSYGNRQLTREEEDENNLSWQVLIMEQGRGKSKMKYIFPIPMTLEMTCYHII